MNYFCISKHSIKKIWHVVILFPCKIPSFFIHKSPIEGKSQKEELVFFTIISLVFFVCEYSQKVPLCFISHFLLTAFSFACVQRFGSFFSDVYISAKNGYLTLFSQAMVSLLWHVENVPQLKQQQKRST